MGEKVLGWAELAEQVLARLLRLKTEDARMEIIRGGFHESLIPQKQDAYKRLAQALAMLKTHETDAEYVPDIVLSIDLRIQRDFVEKFLSTKIVGHEMLADEILWLREYADRNYLEKAVEAARRDLSNPKVSTTTVRRKLLESASGGVDGGGASGTLAEIRRTIHTKNDNEVNVLSAPFHTLWLNTIMNGGLRGKRLVAIGGSQKMRKTTLLRNMFLQLLRDNTLDGTFPEIRENVTATLLAFENDREISYYDFMAMLLAEQLYLRRIHDRVIPGTPWHYIDYANPEKLEDIDAGKLWAGFEQSAPELVRAWYETEAYAEKLDNLSLFDTGRFTGGLTNLEAVINHVYRIAANNKGRLNVVALDYAQLVRVDPQNNGYQNMQAVVTALNQLVAETGVTIIALSQFNSEGKKTTGAGEKSNAYIGTAQGTDLDNATQLYLGTQYEEPNLTVRVLLARRSASGAQTVFTLHPPSGLIIREERGKGSHPVYKVT